MCNTKLSVWSVIAALASKSVVGDYTAEKRSPRRPGNCLAGTSGLMWAGRQCKTPRCPCSGHPGLREDSPLLGPQPAPQGTSAPCQLTCLHPDQKQLPGPQVDRTFLQLWSPELGQSPQCTRGESQWIQPIFLKQGNKSPRLLPGSNQEIRCPWTRYPSPVHCKVLGVGCVYLIL